MSENFTDQQISYNFALSNLFINILRFTNMNIYMYGGSTDLRLPVTLVPFSTINKE